MTYETPAEGNNNKTLYIIISVVAALIILCCCVIIIGAVVLNATGTISLPFSAPALNETYKSHDEFNVEFNYPEELYVEDWEGEYYIGPDRETEDGFWEPDEGEFYMMIYIDFAYSGSPEEALEEWIEDIIEDEMNISDVKSMEVGESEGAYSTISGYFSEVDAEIDGMIVVWEIDRDFYGVSLGFTSEARFSKYKSTMEGILDSFTADVDLDY